MRSEHWSWWFATDAGLAARVAIGAAIFAALASADLMRHGHAATRWREYLFLLAVVAAAMAYGIANDWIASGISPEYFIDGKGLPSTPDLRWSACKIGMKATFSAGLIIGVAFLIANNPRQNRRQLPYRQLFKLLALVLAFAAIGATLGAAIGCHGGWNWTSTDLTAIWQADQFRPRHFMTAFGLNLGSYTGAAAGTITAVIRITQRRPIS